MDKEIERDKEICTKMKHIANSAKYLCVEPGCNQHRLFCQYCIAST